MSHKSKKRRIKQRLLAKALTWALEFQLRKAEIQHLLQELREYCNVCNKIINQKDRRCRGCGRSFPLPEIPNDNN